eukprot:Gb_40303 [translate_table: standard]
MNQNVWQRHYQEHGAIRTRVRRCLCFFERRYQCSTSGYSVGLGGQSICKPVERKPQGNSVYSRKLCGIGRVKEALGNLRNIMENRGIILVDINTYASLLQECIDMKSVIRGMVVQAQMIKTGFEFDVYLQTKLVIMYAKCGSVEAARLVFDKMPKRNEVSWNAMIAGYSQHGYNEEALILLYEMQQAGMKQDQYSFASILKACASLEAMEYGKQVHTCVVKTRFQSHVFVGSALVDMYAKCGNAKSARCVFDRMSRRNVVSWNAMITGCAHHGYFNEALSLFYQMRQFSMNPDQFTFASILRACASLAALELGKQVHACTMRSVDFESDVFLGNALINMYAKCGSIEDARHVFDKTSQRDVISWTTMIAGYGKHGHGEEVVQLFEQMQLTGMKPDHVTFLAVLSACSHAGLVDEGWHYFDSMRRDYCIPPREEHYACMVDLLGRAGHLNEAREIIDRVPFEPTACMWGALLGACRNHGNTELGKGAAERLFELDPQKAGNYVVLSNMYAAAGRWEDVINVREMMKERGIKKEPGCSWIEVKKRVHDFVIGDRSHPQTEEIYAVLERLTQEMKKAGYVPNTNFVLHDLEE